MPQIPPPPESTRPSGSSSAVEWYWRVTCMLASVFHWPVAGFQSSAGYTPAPRSTSSAPEELPPVPSTLPSASTVRLFWRRPYSISPVGVTVGVAPLRSMTSAVFVDGPPPATRILPMSYIAWLP